MNVSGKSFLFIFGAIFLAVVLGSLTTKYVAKRIEQRQGAPVPAPTV
jgi:hypothetical protein